jgi:hypothetical protein
MGLEVKREWRGLGEFIPSFKASLSNAEDSGQWVEDKTKTIPS